MTDTSDYCPLNRDGHKYFVAGKTYTDFVPYDGDRTIMEILDETKLYVRNEYVIQSCNCGSVIRKLVEDK